MRMLKGEMQPAGGHINFLQGKNVITFTPSVGKKDHALSVSDYLAQHTPSPEAVKEVCHNLFGFELKYFLGITERLLRRSPSCSHT